MARILRILVSFVSLVSLVFFYTSSYASTCFASRSSFRCFFVLVLIGSFLLLAF